MNTINFRKAVPEDADRIAQIYDAIHDQEEKGIVTIGWDRNIYPVRETAINAINAGTMFVEEAGGIITACANLNRLQVPEYADAHWEYDAPDDKVMVMHTLVVDPALGGHGYAAAFIDFYERYALENNCPYLRIDTNERNVRARAMYKRFGYKEIDTVPCIFNGIEGVQLVCIEKKL